MSDDAAVQRYADVWIRYVQIVSHQSSSTGLLGDSVAILLFSAAVLGIDAYFASIFLPDIHREYTPFLRPEYETANSNVLLFTGDFTIFAIVVPSITILVFIAMYVEVRGTLASYVDPSSDYHGPSRE